MEAEISIAQTVKNVSSRAPRRAKTKEKMPSEVIEFIATAQNAHQQIIAREKLLQQRMVESEQHISNELQKIHNTIVDLQEILDNASAKEWRTATQALYQEGRQETQHLQDTIGEIRKYVKDTCVHMDSAASQMVKGLSKTLKGLHTAELEQLAEDGSQEVKITGRTAVQQIISVGQWFHWKNLVLIFALTLIAAISTEMFVDDEFPWETHKIVSKERVAGSAVLKAWPQLSYADQSQILNDVG